MTLPPLYLLVGFVAGQRLGELWLSARNTRRLKAMGGVEVGAGHYPLFVLLHAAWLAALLVFVSPTAAPSLPLVALFLLLQLGRIWVISSLGGYWTTRIIHVPGAPLVRRGPFRLVRHPNYLIVAGEVAVLPLAFGAWRLALVFSVLSALLTVYRIRVEEQALRTRPRLDGLTMAGLVKRSINLSGHATSMALEPEFWAVLDQMAADQGLSLAALIGAIDRVRNERPLASACRVAALTRRP